MLRLFFIGGKVDWDDGKITTTRLPTNTTEYNNILSQPTMIRATQAANIVHTVFMTSPEKIEEQFLPLFSMLSMEFFPKTLVTPWLNANFQRSNLESLLFESNAITVLSFVSQNDSTKLRVAPMLEENIQNEKDHGMSDTHKTKAKNTLKGLGKIENIHCIVRIAANICGFIHAFFDVEKGTRPLIYELCIQIMDCITQQDLPAGIMQTRSKCPNSHIIF
jgi:hypothetical protein